MRGSLGGFWLGGDKPVNSYEDVPEKIYMGQQLKAVQDILGYCSYVYGLDFDDWVAIAVAAIDPSLLKKSCFMQDCRPIILKRRLIQSMRVLTEKMITHATVIIMSR